MDNKKFKFSKDSIIIGVTISILSAAFVFNAYGAAGISNLVGYGSSGDYSNPVTTISGSINVLSGQTLTGTTQVTFSNPVKLSTGSINVTIPNGVVIQAQSGVVFDSTKITTNSISTVPLELGNTVRDVGKIQFGIEGVKLNFTKPIKLEIPVSTTQQTVTINARHAGENSYDTTSLTDNFASTCTNGVASSQSSSATVSNGIATIYTCSASDFIALVPSTSSSGGGGGLGGVGGYYTKDKCENGDYSPSIYDGKCGTAPVISGGVYNGEKSNKNTIDNKKVELKSINYNGYTIKHITGYENSDKIMKLSKIVISSKKIKDSEKKQYIDSLNRFLILNYAYNNTEKTDKLILAYKIQAENLKNILKKLKN